VIAAKEVELLGHIINEEGIKTSPKKTESIENFPIPTSKTEMRAFLGLAGYYRSFIKDFSTIVKPLSELLKENTTIRWTGDKADYWTRERQETFDLIKRKLTTAPILARPNEELPYILYTDASAIGFGAILSQVQEGKERVIAYASQTTSEPESRYGATQLELKAVVWATKHFRHYLIGAPFKLVTDHSALKWMYNSKDLNSIHARWMMRLQEYDIDFCYRPGRVHQNVDVLSRIPKEKETTRNPPLGTHFVTRLPKQGQLDFG
jgi:hypothetical protein